MQRSANCPDFIIVYCIYGLNDHIVPCIYVQLCADYKLHTCAYVYVYERSGLTDCILHSYQWLSIKWDQLSEWVYTAFKMKNKKRSQVLTSCVPVYMHMCFKLKVVDNSGFHCVWDSSNYLEKAADFSKVLWSAWFPCSTNVQGIGYSLLLFKMVTKKAEIS